MPLQALEEADRAAAQGRLSADIKWIFAQKLVPLDYQLALAHGGFGSLDNFIGLGETRLEVREALAHGFNVRPEEDLGTRAGIASVMAAWEAAKLYTKTEDTAKAEARVAAMVRPTGTTAYQAMKAGAEADIGRKIEAKCMPGKFYLGKKEEELEENELQAETWDKVTSREDGEPVLMTTQVSNDGVLRLKQTTVAGKLPEGPEELREKMELYATTFLLLKNKHTNKPVLADLTKQLFTDYVAYLLSTKVHRLEFGGGEERNRFGPSWKLVLAYELEIRKKACEWVNFEGFTWAEALRKAWSDPELKQLYFTAPLSLGERRIVGSRGGTPPAAAGSAGGGTGGGGKGTGGGGSSSGGAGGKGGSGSGGGGPKGGGTGAPSGKPKSQMPDGREICFAWNKDPKSCAGSCGRVHACQLCFKESHPMCEHRAGGPRGLTTKSSKKKRTFRSGGKADE